MEDQLLQSQIVFELVYKLIAFEFCSTSAPESVDLLILCLLRFGLGVPPPPKKKKTFAGRIRVGGEGIPLYFLFYYVFCGVYPPKK